MKHIRTFENFLNEVATPRLLKSAGQNLARQVKDEKNYTVDQLKDRLLSTPIARMLSDDEILTVLDHAKEELGMDEKITYPEGGTSSGDKIIDKLAKLLNSSSAKIEVTNNQVRGVNVSFGFAPESTFFVKANDDHYLMNTNKGFYRVDKKDITKAEDLYDELESIIQAGKTKRPSSRETDMFGKK